MHINRIGITMLMLLNISPAWAATEYPATLAAHAIIPADSFITPPEKAPLFLQSSGKIAPTVTNTFALNPPFKGQPIQGHSGIKYIPNDKTYWVITDNGAGAKNNSADFMLYLNQYKIDFDKNKFTRLKTIYLHDPDKKVPFPISVTKNNPQRYLTGSDFDPESFQIIGDSLWIGEEFGPYLIQADLDGKIIQVFPTIIDGKPIYSPDSPGLTDSKYKSNINRSKGFEGLAKSKDEKMLYALLEGPIFDNNKQSFETVDDKTVLRILEFDVQTKKWTGRFWYYPLENKDYAIGDFNLINDTTALVIERDNYEGTKQYSCEKSTQQNCYQNIAKFKRIYKIELSQKNLSQNVAKLAYIDLLKIQDPKKVARAPLDEDYFSFPFFTIENVDIVDKQHIIVGNDNNLPYSHGRKPDQTDANEFILLEVAKFLAD